MAMAALPSEYGPFGEVVRATGPMAKINPFRFSTKYQDDETDLLYYGYRYYNAIMGRWTSRDPINDSGFKLQRSERKRKYHLNEEKNLYGFVGNDPIKAFDAFGLQNWNPRYWQQCGTIVTRAIEPEEDPDWWTKLHETISGIFYPHWFIILADGNRLTHGGEANGENHRTAHKHPLLIPACESCKKFTKCLTDNWPDPSTYNWATDNCGDAVLNTVTKCGGLNDFNVPYEPVLN